MSNNEMVNQLQSKLEETYIDDFYISLIDSNHNLLLLGSSDFSYYHEIEIILYGVSFICCSIDSFVVNHIRFANDKEVIKLKNVMYDAWEGNIIALEDTVCHTCYYIVMDRIEYNFQLIKYFDELGNRISGNKLSNWAKNILAIKK